MTQVSKKTPQMSVQYIELIGTEYPGRRFVLKKAETKSEEICPTLFSVLRDDGTLLLIIPALEE
jgi:hypothetical protein